MCFHLNSERKYFIMDALDMVFKTFYYQICDIAKWIFAIKMASDIIKNGNNGDMSGVIKTLIGGGIGYASLYAVISVLDSVQAQFPQ